MRPDAISYTIVMNDWAGCGSRAAPRRADQIMRHMRELQDNVNAAAGPDTVAYNMEFRAWALCGEEGGVDFMEQSVRVTAPLRPPRTLI